MQYLTPIKGLKNVFAPLLRAELLLYKRSRGEDGAGSRHGVAPGADAGGLRWPRAAGHGPHGRQCFCRFIVLSAVLLLLLQRVHPCKANSARYLQRGAEPWPG